METLLGLIVFLLLFGGLIYLIIIAIKGKKAVYQSSVNSKKLEGTRTGERQFLFKTKIIGDLLFPVLWIGCFATLFFLEADFYSALFGTLFLTWFMFFRIYFIFKSRSDKVILDDHKMKFHIQGETIEVHLLDFQQVNLEFQKLSSYNGSYVLPLLKLIQGSEKEISLTNAALRQYPHEIVEAIGILNSKLQCRKTWNDTIKKRIEITEL